MSSTTISKNLLRVLLVENPENADSNIKELLEVDRHTVDTAVSKTQALIQLEQTSYDLVLCSLSTSQNAELCRKIKTKQDIHYIVMAEQPSELDKLEALEAGANEILAKPVNLLELLLRVTTLAKRKQQKKRKDRQQYGDMEIRTSSRQLWIAEKEIALTKIEFTLLKTLLQEIGTSYSKEDLATACWGSAEWLGNGHTLNVHISNLRRKINQSSKITIFAIRGFGYRAELKN